MYKEHINQKNSAPDEMQQKMIFSKYDTVFDDDESFNIKEDELDAKSVSNDSKMTGNDTGLPTSDVNEQFE